MSQVIAPPLGGLSFGPIAILFGPGLDPNDLTSDNTPTARSASSIAGVPLVATPFDQTQGDLALCGVGSLYLSRADGSLWSKTGAVDPTHPTGTWEAHA
jgi:hypothetical protein